MMMVMVMMMFMLVIVIVMIVVVVLRFLMFMIVIMIMFFIMIRFFMLMLMLMLMFRFFMFVLVVVMIFFVFVIMVVIVVVVFIFVMVMFRRRKERVFYDLRHDKRVDAVEFRKIFIRTADCEEKRRRARLHDIVGTRFIRVQIAVIDEIIRLDGRAFRERTRPVIEGIDRCDDFRTGRFFFRLFVFFCCGSIPCTSRETHEGREHDNAFFPIFHIKKTSFFFWVHK